VENLVGDFGRAPEIPGDNGAVSRVPSGSIRAAQELGPFLEEEDVQGLLDGRLVASHHLQGWAIVTLAAAGAQAGAQPRKAKERCQAPRGWAGLMKAILSHTHSG
jgi:hypothetical protein